MPTCPATMKTNRNSFAIAIVSAACLFAASSFAQQAKPATGGAEGSVVTTDRSMNVENDAVSTSAEHHYNSPAERANDDLIITEVKSALAEKGISNGYPVEVDSDHGTVLLSGVVASADDAKQAQALAMNTKGVVGVKNKLTWR